MRMFNSSPSEASMSQMQAIFPEKENKLKEIEERKNKLMLALKKL